MVLSAGDSARYGIVTASDVMVSMRGGQRLATDIHRPAIDGVPLAGRFPTILGRTAYDKTNEMQWLDPVVRYFAPRGYVVVVQDIRGRHHSEGAEYYHTANPWEGEDGYDTIEWIAGQDWSNGRVGMVGSSHNAIVQQVAAILRPPHLAAIWPNVGPTNIYEHEAREGGTMSLQMFGALFMHAYQDARANPVAKEAIAGAMRQVSEWVWRTPFKPGQTPLAHFPYLEQTLFNYYYRGRYDDWWGQRCCNQEPYWKDHADIPATFSGGWFDPFSAGTTRYFTTMAAQNKTPQRLIMGPWTHDSMTRGGSVDGDVDFGPDAAWGPERYSGAQLGWFERWLTETDAPAADRRAPDPPVEIFVMGTGDGHKTAAGHLFHGGYWRHEQEWPLSRATHVDHYFRSDGRLTIEAPGPDEAARSYLYDPQKPVPTIGGNIASFFELVDVPGVSEARSRYIPWYVRMRNIVPPGPFHQIERPGVIGAQSPYLPLASRPDVLVFETSPLTAPCEVTGSCFVRLWISSDAPDTDFTAKLVDVYPPSADYPDGYHLNLVDSVIRARYRNGWDQETTMQPGTAYQVEIALPPTSNVFKGGHRIRVDVSSSNFPRFDTNPNTGEPVGRHTHSRPARNTVYVDASRASHVALPIVAT